MTTKNVTETPCKNNRKLQAQAQRQEADEEEAVRFLWLPSGDWGPSEKDKDTEGGLGRVCFTGYVGTYGACFASVSRKQW